MPGDDHLLHGPATLVDKVMTTVRRRIRDGGYPAGGRLPSIRMLARQMAVSTATVVTAYDRLAAESEIAPRRGSGFFVAPKPREQGFPRPAVRERQINPLWVMHQSLEAPSDARVPGCGWLPIDWMPHDAVRRALRAQARESAGALVGYGSPLGFAPLRGLLSRRLADRDIPAGPAQILLTDSGTQALDLICRLLVRPGDAVLVDDPCYFNFLNIIAAHGAEPVGVPYTRQGPDIAQLRSIMPRGDIKLYVTTGALHNPTGVTPTPAVQHQLLNLAHAHGVVVVEDDIFGDLAEEPSPRLAAFDELDRVIYVGGTSKTLSATLRCGFIAARQEWVDTLLDLKLAATFGSNDLSARVVHHLLSDGSYRRHLDVTRGKLHRARAATIDALRTMGIEPWHEPRGGLFVWGLLPSGMSAIDVAKRAESRDLLLAPGDVFSSGQRATGALRFNAAHCCAPGVFGILRDVMLSFERDG
jgi:DNA-binding transcriptional MocR family regulator